MTSPDSTPNERAGTHRMIADIATLQTQMAHAAQALDDMKKVNKEQSDKLDAVLLQLATARGGWKTMVWFGGAAATFGGSIVAGLGWLIEHLPRVHA